MAFQMVLTGRAVGPSIIYVERVMESESAEQAALALYGEVVMSFSDLNRLGQRP